MKPLVRGYRVCFGIGLSLALHHSTASKYFSEVNLVASLYAISPSISRQYRPNKQFYITLNMMSWTNTG